MPVEHALQHAGSVYCTPDWVREYARMLMPRYLWILTDGRTRWLRCEACETQWEEHKGRRWPNALTHNEPACCPRCGEMVTPKQMGRGYGNIRDRLQLIWYEGSHDHDGDVVAYGALCERDFAFADERPWTLDATIEVRSFAVFQYGEDGFRFRHRWTRWEGPDGEIREGWRFEPISRLGHLTFGSDMSAMRMYRDPIPTQLIEESLYGAIRGTPFEKAWDWDYMLNDRGFDGVEALTLIARYPCIEYLTKLGMTDLLPARLLGHLPAGEVNWNGGSMAKVLRLSKTRLGELKHAGIRVTAALLTVLHWLEREEIHLTARQAEMLAEGLRRTTTPERFGAMLANGLKVFEPSRRRKALKYVAATMTKRARDTRLHFGDISDYWKNAADLGDDMNADATAFPSDLGAAEARVLERRRRRKEEEDAAKNAAKDEQIRKRWKALNRKYGFHFGGLTLRPAMDCAEVIREGNVLKHCVAGYVSDYAAGRTVICVLRRDCDPDMPWRTVEISSAGMLVQDRGFHNDRTGFGLAMTENYRAALNLFWAAWRERNRRTNAA